MDIFWVCTISIHILGGQFSSKLPDSAQGKLFDRVLTIRPKISKFSKQGQMVRKFLEKSSRKSGNC